MKTYDVIIIGAGSIGVPCALACAKAGLTVGIIDVLPSVGAGQNKTAIGGVRATHSDIAKITIAKRSLEIFSNWEELYGDDIGFKKGGYCFPAYTEKDEKNFKDLLVIQKQFRLNIDWLEKDKLIELVKGITEQNLRGGTFSPDDGSASPLLAINAFYKKAKEFKADFYFNEKVTGIILKNNTIHQVKTDKAIYTTKTVINAAGAFAKEIGAMIGINVPVFPDSHEAGITEPTKQFLVPMIVDMRPFPGSKNFYFYQNKEGQILFCLTPDPIIKGTNNRSTSGFLPLVAERIKHIFPRILKLKVRRVWRGLYPMTDDGIPIVGKVKELACFINAVGMCGQGFMLGPGLGEILASLVTCNLTESDTKVLEKLSLYGDYSQCQEFFL